MSPARRAADNQTEQEANANADRVSRMSTSNEEQPLPGNIKED